MKLALCKNCTQMTNHSYGVCLKCKKTRIEELIKEIKRECGGRCKQKDYIEGCFECRTRVAIDFLNEYKDLEDW